MRCSASLIGLFVLASLGAYPADSPTVHIVGHYSDRQLVEVHTLILPRIFLYDANNHLVPEEQWPADLADVGKHKDDGHCCLSYTKSVGGGPPPECANPVYGNGGPNWSGLMDVRGRTMELQTAPHHKWLIVEYGASWCAPCVVQEKQLNQVLASVRNASDYVWITIDMTRITVAKDAVKKASGM